MTGVTDLLDWTPWRPLATASTDATIPRSPGLYRIRRVGRDDLDYIGQTGMQLKRRLAMLRGVYAEEMPYRDPHTAAPALWALRHATGCDFEVSVVPVAVSTPWRKGLEALAIGLYRQEHGRSPTVAFGRMPVGYHPSSANNARLVWLGKRARGGPALDAPHASHEPGVPPAGRLDGDPQGPDWGGHRWSHWMALSPEIRDVIGDGTGLYRMRGDDDGQLLYIGQGRIADRLLAHLAKRSQSDHAQGCIFVGQERLECSWVVSDEWLPHQRLELENDLIAAHMLGNGEVPDVQFLG